MIEHHGIARAPRWRLIALMADVTRSDPELAEGACKPPRKEFVEEQPDGGSPRRGATSC